MDLRQLRHFVVTVEAGSITAASRRLFLAQSALSRQLAALERQVGQRLLHRRPDGVVPTEHGRRFLQDARAVLDVYDAAFPLRPTDPGAGAEGVPATVRVGLGVAVGRDLLPAARRRLQAAHPGTELSVAQLPFGQAPVQLVAGRLDVAVVWLPLSATLPVRVTPLVEEPRGVALPAGHRLADLERIDFSLLLDEPFLALPAWTGALRSFWLAEDQRAGHPPRIGAVVQGPEEAIEALGQGLGVALISAGNADLYRRSEFVVRPVDGVPRSTLAAITRVGEERPPVLDVVAALSETAATRAGGVRPSSGSADG